MPSSVNKPTYVVGVGASAGGVEALEILFSHLASDTGMAFVVIQHLSPDFKSFMNEILSRRTTMKIHLAENGMLVEANNIYLIPSKNRMTIKDGRLVLHDRESDGKINHLIDLFFESLAHDQGEKAIGVILSGTGSDGKNGVREIAQLGGLVLVQSPHTADFDGMPHSAINTGCVHGIFPIDKIVEYLPLLADMQPRPLDPVTENSLLETHLHRSYLPIFEVLKREYGIGFQNYKLPTIVRRISNRLEDRKIASLQEYTELLSSDLQEVEALYQSLLIGVTEFFRDPKVFDHLERVIIPHLMEKNPDGIRLWSIACASGEEAYSLAILCCEVARKVKFTGTISIFATDVDHRSVAHASNGQYKIDQLSKLSSEWVENYFIKDSDRFYTVKPFLRKMIVFSRHDCLTDTAFTKMDLISCRNLMIYLKKNAQDVLFATMHFSLKEDGYLLLGSSEAVRQDMAEFIVVSDKCKVFRKNHRVKSLPPIPKSPFVMHHTIQQYRSLHAGISSDNSAELLHNYEYVLSKYVPAGFIVDEHYEIIHYFGKASQFLEEETGRARKNIVERAAEDFRLALTSTLQRVKKEHASIVVKRVSLVNREGKQKAYDLFVDPIPHTRLEGKRFHISIIPSEPDKQRQSPVIEQKFTHSEVTNLRIEELEKELLATKISLNVALEDVQTSNEELLTTNEELIATNEELQSSNEELASVNEELLTVNNEFERKNQELLALNQDHSNLLENIDTGIVFLDRNLLVKNFNHSVYRSLKLLRRDVNRSIQDIAYPFESEKEFIKDLRAVIEHGLIKEKEITGLDDRCMIRRAVPYYGKNRAVEGIILSFTDITDIKGLQNQLDQAIIASKLVWWEWDLVNDTFETHTRDKCILGYDHNLLPSKVDHWWSLIHPEDIAQVRKSLQTCLDGQVENWNCQHRFLTKDKVWKWVMNSGKVIRWDSEGKPLKMTGTTQDISDLKLQEEERNEAIVLRKKAEEDAKRMKDLVEELDYANRTKDEFLSLVSHEIRTPLNPIIGLTEILLEETKNNPQIHHLLETVYKAGLNLLELINDILDYRKIEAGFIQLYPMATNLHDLVEEVVHLHEPKAKEKGVALTASFNADAALYLVMADGQKFKQVMNNLVSNAVKFTNTGSVQIKANFLNEDAGYRNFIFEVIDTGLGIAEENQQKIFAPFSQVDSSQTRKYGGTGLGLTICEKIVETMGGAISVFSQLGQGATFRVELTFPLTVPMFSAPSRTAEEPPQEAPVSSATCKKILLVEDNSANRLLVKKILTAKGYDVDEAANGKEGVEAFDRVNYCAILMDISMPVMDGLEATRMIRNNPKNGKDVFIVGLTAHVAENNVEKCINCGMDSVLRKPFKSGDLLQILETR